MSSFSYRLILPQTSVYSATKKAIADFSELLRDYLKFADTESEDNNGQDIQILRVEPLGIQTKFINYQKNFSVITPEECVKSVLQSLAVGETYTNSHWKHKIFIPLIIAVKNFIPGLEDSVKQIYYNLQQKQIIEF
ncbi:hypothetical protein PPERSA_11901 [Pseudocohnilembus persalinus]|uniref:Uncharacterized protein n=1 Tax=Pseudocohnilembus persalinus TaxID=266149 RepID=A0A0V0QK52_PSEPJ|nr:hypothetical protein PPERSA_11901 [Pseudocohnilembus persalinus]|eukprot:KRX02561.1 hypothetical protein PPERSA_11901 [Pseudocohnilembus persalinus]